MLITKTQHHLAKKTFFKLQKRNKRKGGGRSKQENKIMEGKERIAELELELRVNGSLIDMLKELAISQRKTILKQKQRIEELTPDIIA